MKICFGVLGLCFALANISGAAAFSAKAPQIDMFPPGTFPQVDRIEGGGTVKTYPMPPWAERVQYTLSTNGRPLKCTVQLWIGPLRNVHTMEIDAQDGSITPYSATIKFKKLAPVLKISTSKDQTMPVIASVSVPSPERASVLAKNTEQLWKTATPHEKLLIQGGSTMGGGGSIRTWTIPTNVRTVQAICWSKDTSKKSLKAMIEVLNGPNNQRQIYNLQCGGGSQPYHAVFQTPGPGWQVRVRNKKFVEDGLFEMVVMPLEGEGDVSAGLDANPVVPFAPRKQWWE